jgi:hypothetical protein
LGKRRLAQTLWIAWAIIVWNVTFDRAIVVAGRQYLSAARAAASDQSSAHVRMDDWMRPALTRGFWIASTVSGALLLTGFVMIRLAASDGLPAQDN